jgi:hypothetical protein
MIWTAWNNGKNHPSGAGYGFKIGAGDRDRTFMQKWRQITIQLPTPSGDMVAAVNVDKESFWGDCRELISGVIGLWLSDQGFAPWPKGRPPKFDVEQLKAASFHVKGATRRG